MEKKILLLLVILISSICFSFSQKITVLQDKVLDKKTGKDLNYCNREGIKCVYKGASPNSGGEMLGFASMGEHGFLYRDKFHFTFYDNDLNKKWEKDVDPEMNYTTNSGIDMIDGENSCYFIEEGTKKTSIIKFLPDGSLIKTLLVYDEIKDISANYYQNYFVSNDNLFFLASAYNSKQKEFIYHLVSFNDKLEMNAVRIDLKHNSDEIKRIANNENEYEWSLKNVSDGKFYFIKKYFAKTLGNEDTKELIMSFAEYSKSNSAIIYTEIPFGNGQFPHNYYTLPSIYFDAEKQTLQFYGNFTDKIAANVVRKYFLGFFAFKYSITDKKFIYSKNYFYKELKDKMGEESKLKEKVNEFYNQANVSFTYGGPDLGTDNFILSIEESTSGAHLDKVETCEVRLNGSGEIIKMDELSYVNSVNNFGSVLWPATSVNRFTSSDAPASIYDFIYSQAGKVETNYLLSKIYKRKDFYTVVYINDKDSELRGFKVKVE